VHLAVSLSVTAGADSARRCGGEQSVGPS